ncbi:hypothetical protein L1987_37260 [Smallanthus sonchifolius]|uniref:Uncharacterized protein n=1 Tax=Smallanthus sonchifolius TaxID=185202 RepID=A0ACB9HGA7_9ASTR|nr:hypothetical protein L1987_37260 [Smallanthus sonchifolius]
MVIDCTADKQRNESWLFVYSRLSQVLGWILLAFKRKDRTCISKEWDIFNARMSCTWSFAECYQASH